MLATRMRQSAFGPIRLHDSATSETTSGGNTTSHTVSLPSSIPAGSFLIIILGCADTRQVTWPAGWTELTEDDGSSPNATSSIAYRTADGTEGSSITVTTEAGTTIAAVAACFTGVASDTPELSSVSVQGSTSAPNTNSVTPSWGSRTLFLSVVGGRGNSSGHSVTNPPSGYSTVGSTYTTQGNDAFAIMAMLGPQAGAAQDPGAWALSASVDRAVGRTVAIR